jgi:hypothetical protein
VHPIPVAVSVLLIVIAILILIVLVAMEIQNFADGKTACIGSGLGEFEKNSAGLSGLRGYKRQEMII